MVGQDLSGMSTSLEGPTKGDMVLAASMEELADEFMTSRPQEDPTNVEAVILASWQDLLWERLCGLNHQTARLLFAVGLSVMAELSKSSSINTVVSNGHTPVSLKPAVMFP